VHVHYIDGSYEVYYCLRALRKVGGETGLFLPSYHVSSQLQKTRCVAKRSWWTLGCLESETRERPNRHHLCAQCPSCNPAGWCPGTKRYDFSLMHSANDIPCDPQRFCKDVLVAKQVKNDSAQAIDGFKLCIVSEWMECGNTHTYLRNNEVTDRTELVSPRPHP